jgi:DNA-binding transcriptional LysR family regulator
MRSGELINVLASWEARATRLDPAIWAVYPPKKVVSSKVRAFVDFYAEIFSDDAYWNE